jgi:ATP-binding cassette subfamily B (MDR/TAP) protein 1
MGQFFAHSADLSKGVTAANAIRLMQDQVPQSSQSTKSFEGFESIADDAPLVEFENVSFVYPARPNHPVLHNLSISLKRGQYIALVGPSGCGKSTTIGLIERFYNASSGRVLMGGMDVCDLATNDIRKEFSLVSQEPVLFQGTIKENILLGARHPIDDARLDIIAKQAQIYDLISSLPEGYETNVGMGGTALSGGQKQRIAIARAIAQDASVLLLDEATSALDSQSEALVQDALMEAGKGRGVIAIAHRLSTIRHADIIYVINGGTVVEEGTYDNLVAKRGVFYSMVRSTLPFN